MPTTSETMKAGRVARDAEGREVTVIDPVTMYLANRDDAPIEREPLRAIAETIIPGQRARLLAAIATGVLLAIVLALGQLAWHRAKGGWPKIDAPSAIIWTMQLGLCSTMAVLVWREGRKAMRRRAFAVLLAHARCPHCGYDLEGHSPDDAGVTRCPECGCAWRLGDVDRAAATARDPSARHAGPGTILAIMAASILLMIGLVIAVITWLT